MEDGTWQKGQFTGNGTLVLASKVITNNENKTITVFKYEGEFKDGKFHGHGKVMNPASIYKGQFENNMRNGKGEMYSFGDTFTGDFKDGKFIKGKILYKDGTECVGEFVDGCKNGFCSINYPNGDYFHGIFKMDKRCGAGTQKTNGLITRCEWREEEKIGLIEEVKGRLSIKYTVGDSNAEIVVQNVQSLDVVALSDALIMSDAEEDPEEGKGYTLKFFGQVNKEFRPLKGVMEIEGVLRFIGEWKDGQLDCVAKVIDIQNGVYEEQVFVNGKRMQKKN